VIIMIIPDSPVESALYEFLEWLDDIPVIYGTLIMFGVQTGAIIPMLPGTPFNLACGFLFDVWIGAAVAVASADVAAIVSFLFVRFVARGWTAQQIEKKAEIQSDRQSSGETRDVADSANPFFSYLAVRTLQLYARPHKYTFLEVLGVFHHRSHPLYHCLRLPRFPSTGARRNIQR